MSEKFKCAKCNYPGEDNSLKLIVEDGVIHTFIINDDGSLELENTDGIGQKIYLQCDLCGHKYEIENDSINIEPDYNLFHYGFNGERKKLNINNCLFEALKLLVP